MTFANIIYRIIFLTSIITLLSCQDNTDQLDRGFSTNVSDIDTLIMLKDGDLSAWNNNYPDHWMFKDGLLIGSTMDNLLDRAIWITTTEKYEDFILELKVKLIGDANKNSGIYYRGEWDDNHVVGYELDIGGWGDDENAVWWGQLHDPYRREELWIGPEGKELDSVYFDNEWNEIKIKAEGNHIQHWVNGIKTVDWFEKDSTIQKRGFIGFQLHDETRNKVSFKEIKLIKLQAIK